MATADGRRVRFFANAKSGDRSAKRRLAVLLILSLAWYAALTADGLVATKLEYWAAAAATLIFYPLAVLIIASMLREPAPRWLERLPLDLVEKFAPIVLVGVAVAVLIQVPADLDAKAPVGNDNSASVICAARAVLEGHDPYQESDVTCLRSLHAPIALATPLQRGMFARQRTYPTPAELQEAASRAEAHRGHSRAFATFGYLPMSFVWMLPVAAGDHQAWAAYIVLAALVWLVLASFGAGPLWPALALVLMAQVGDGGLMAAATQSDGEFFAYASVVLALIWLDRGRLSGMLLGLGMAWHPLVWVIWFGYALFTKGLPDFRRRMLWSVATAAGLTVPWLVLEPGAIASVLGLIFQPNYPVGAGLVLLLGGAPDPLFRHLLLGAVVVGFVGFCGFAGWRAQWRSALPAVALGFMWLGWRSDVSYLSVVFPLAAAMTVGLYRLHRPLGGAASESDDSGGSRRPENSLNRLLVSTRAALTPSHLTTNLIRVLGRPNVRCRAVAIGLTLGLWSTRAVADQVEGQAATCYPVGVYAEAKAGGPSGRHTVITQRATTIAKALSRMCQFRARQFERFAASTL